MVGKKNVENEKKTIQIKATTGAWWKSTKAEEVSVDAPAASEPKKTAPKVAKQPRKPSPRKRVSKKPSEPVNEEKQVIEVEKESGAAPEKIKAPRKTPRKQAPRKTKDSAKKDQKESVQASEIVSAAEAGPDETVADVSSPETEENLQKPKRPTKSTRGRRGKRPGKKPTGEETAQVAEESTAGVVSNGEKDLDSSVQEPKKTAKKTVKAAEPEEEKKPCKLLINAEEPEECRLALLEDGRLESIHVSTISKTQTKNNIYKARIVAVEPSLQAAFIDYGTEKNGFLPFSEIHPEYYKQELSDNVRQLVEAQQWKKLTITDVVEKGQEILAQVVKEEVGKKGANMTTFLSIPGRCVVLMPGSDSSGISRKISGEERRSQLRDTMKSLDLPEGIGWIVRTASVDITQETLSRDVEYLLELWADIKKKGQELNGAGLVYEDQKSVLRFLREHFDPSMEEILVDDRTALDEVKAFIKMLPANQRSVKVRLHQGARPIFNQYSVEDQIESIYQPQVNLPSGGSIVIDPTEALVAIDVNSGSTSKGKNFEASIFQANMEAAEELARQLRLRDLGGLIVVDFIDMRSRKNILAVEKKIKAAMKRDKAKVDFSRISKFGLMEISRQKLGAPIEAGNYRRCEHCMGRGTVRSIETLSLYYLRRIQTGASRKPVERIECHFPLDVASYLLNNKRSEVNEMEKRCQVEITIIAETGMKPADNELIFHKAEKETNSKKQA
jgi:ribonuclease E